MSQFRNDLDSYELQDEANNKSTLRLEFKISSDELLDSRDLGLFDDWKAAAIERTKNSSTKNREETRAWIKFRQALAGLFLLLEKPQAGDEFKNLVQACVDSVKKAYEEGCNVCRENEKLAVPLQLKTEWQSATDMSYP